MCGLAHSSLVTKDIVNVQGPTSLSVLKIKPFNCILYMRDEETFFFITKRVNLPLVNRLLGNRHFK